jgi:hypothetical protein
MTSLAVARHRASTKVTGAVADPAAAVMAVAGPCPGRSTGPRELLDPAWLDRELDLVVSAVQRYRPGVAPAELARLAAATAEELAARHPVDGYFPVLVRVALLGRLPEG